MKRSLLLFSSILLSTLLFSQAPPVTATFSVADTAIEEGNSGSFVYQGMVEVSGQPSGNIVYEVILSGGTATEGADFTFTPQIITFTPTNYGPQVVHVTILGNNSYEEDETLLLSLNYVSGPGGIGADPVQEVLILNDDAPNTFINEFHYDSQLDSITPQFVEIVVQEDHNSCIAETVLYLYDGATGLVYDTTGLAGFMTATTDNGFDYLLQFFFPIISSTIENGSPDGMALVYRDTVVQLLSYEGSFTAVDGPAAGMTFPDVGMEEDLSTPVMNSIYLEGTGTVYSDFTWTSGTGTPGFSNSFGQVLPVELISLDANRVGEEVEVQWKTASEKDNAYFIIERSRDGRTFHEVGKIKGKGTSNVENLYRFLDVSPLSTVSYYRLKQKDMNGNYTYSHIVKLNYAGEPRDMTIYPNPAIENLTLDINTPMNEVITVEVLDAMGKSIKMDKIALEKGINSMNLDVKDLEHGMYYIRVLKDNDRHVKQFVKN